MEIPDINNRILQVVDLKCKGNRNKFAENINIAQQKLNRLFNIDTRTNKFPVVPIDVIIAITEMYVDLNTEWLLTGNGPMLKNKESPGGLDNQESNTLIRELIDKNGDLRQLLGEQTNENQRLHEENMRLVAEIGDLKGEKSPISKRVIFDKTDNNQDIAAEPEGSYK